MKVALVTWLDATRRDDEVSATESIGVTRRTVGWLLRRDAKGVVLAFSRDESTFERGFMIPASYVRSVKVLADVP